MARDAKQLGARVVRAAKAREPFGPTAENRRHNGDGFHIVHRGGAAIQASACRKRRLHAGHALFTFKAFQKRGFLAANVSASTVVQVKIEIIARPTGVFAQQTRIIAFVNGSLQRLTLADVFAANVDVAIIGPHRERGDQRAFDQRVGIVAHNLAVFAGARFRFVGIDHQIRRPTVGCLGHERPLQPRREPCPTAPAQAGCFHNLDDLIAAQSQNARRAIPMAPLARALQGAVVHPVQIGKDAVLILEHLPVPLFATQRAYFAWPLRQSR